MLRVRTFFGLLGLWFNPEELNMSYGTPQTASYTEYGSVVGTSTMTTINSQNYYTLNGGNRYATDEATLSFKTTQANQQVQIEIRSSSSTSDYMCAGILDSDSITTAQIKISGTQSQTYTYTVPSAGDHYIKFFFRNSESASGGNNKGYFRLIPFQNTETVINNATGQVEVKSYTDWKLYSKSDWIASVTPTQATRGKLNLAIQATPNYGNPRQGNITLQETKKGELYTLPINQTSTANKLQLSRNYVAVNDDAGSVTITVNLFGSTSWSVPQGSWYTINPTSGGDNATVTISWGANTGGERSASIVFTGNNGGQDTLILEQETYICHCDCNTFCSCDIDIDCPTHYTGYCSCDTELNCSCDSVCGCNNNRNQCSCDTETCACNTDVCSCDTHTACTCETQSCSCNTQTGCGSDICPCDTESCSCYSDRCSCDTQTCSCNTVCSLNYNSCTSNRVSCSCQGDTCSCENVCTCNDNVCQCDGNRCTCDQNKCPSNILCSKDSICMAEGSSCTCNSDVCACNQEACSCEGVCNCDGHCQCDTVCSCNINCTCDTDTCPSDTGASCTCQSVQCTYENCTTYYSCLDSSGCLDVICSGECRGNSSICSPVSEICPSNQLSCIKELSNCPYEDCRTDLCATAIEESLNTVSNKSNLDDVETYSSNCSCNNEASTYASCSGVTCASVGICSPIGQVCSDDAGVCTDLCTQDICPTNYICAAEGQMCTGEIICTQLTCTDDTICSPVSCLSIGSCTQVSCTAQLCTTITCSCDSNNPCICDNYNPCTSNICSCNTQSTCSCNNECPSNSTAICLDRSLVCMGDLCSCNTEACTCDNVCTCNSDTKCTCQGICTCDGVCPCNSNASCGDNTRLCSDDSCTYYTTCTCDTICGTYGSGTGNTCICDEESYCKCQTVCGCDSQWGCTSDVCTCQGVCTCNMQSSCPCNSDYNSDYSCSCNSQCTCYNEYDCTCDNVCTCNNDTNCSCVGVCSSYKASTCTCDSQCTCNSNYDCTCDNVCRCDYDRQYSCNCDSNYTSDKCSTDLVCPTQCTSDVNCSCNNYVAVN